MAAGSIGAGSATPSLAGARAGGQAAAEATLGNGRRTTPAATERPAALRDAVAGADAIAGAPAVRAAVDVERPVLRPGAGDAVPGPAAVAARLSTWSGRTDAAGATDGADSTDAGGAQALAGDDGAGGDVAPATADANELDAAVPEADRPAVAADQPNPPGEDPAYWTETPYYVGEDGTVFLAVWDADSGSLLLTRTGEVVELDGGGQVTRTYAGRVEADGTAVIGWSGTGTNADGAPLAEDGVRLEFPTGDWTQEIVREDASEGRPRRTFIQESDVQGVASMTSSSLTVTEGTLDAPIAGEFETTWRQETSNGSFNEVSEGGSSATMRSTDGPFDPWNPSPDSLPEDVTVRDAWGRYTVTSLAPTPAGDHPRLVVERRLQQPYTFRFGGLQEQPAWEYRTNPVSDGDPWQPAGQPEPWLATGPSHRGNERTWQQNAELGALVVSMVPGPIGISGTVAGELINNFATSELSATTYGAARAAGTVPRAGRPIAGAGSGIVALPAIYANLRADNSFTTGGTRGLWLAPGWANQAPVPAQDAFVPSYARPLLDGPPEPHIELDDSADDSEISVRDRGGRHEDAPLRLRAEDGQVQVFGPNGDWTTVDPAGRVDFEDGSLTWYLDGDGRLVVSWTDLYGQTSTVVAADGVDAEPIPVQGSRDGAARAANMVLATRDPRIDD